MRYINYIVFTNIYQLVSRYNLSFTIKFSIRFFIALTSNEYCLVRRVEGGEREEEEGGGGVYPEL